jgi:hypothetical protein
MEDITREASMYLSDLVVAGSGFETMISEIDNVSSDELTLSALATSYTTSPSVFYSDGTKTQMFQNAVSSTVTAGLSFANSLNQFEIRMSVGKQGSFASAGLYTPMILFSDSSVVPTATHVAAPTLIGISSNQTGVGIIFGPNIAVDDFVPLQVNYWLRGSFITRDVVPTIPAWSDIIIRYNGYGVVILDASTGETLYNSYPLRNLQSYFGVKRVFGYTYLRNDASVSTLHGVNMVIRSNILNN